MKPPSKTTSSSQITSELEAKLVIALIRGDFSVFYIEIVDSYSAGIYTLISCEYI